MKITTDNLRGKNWSHISTVFSRMKTLTVMVNGKRADNEVELALEPGGDAVLSVTVPKSKERKPKVARARFDDVGYS